LLIEIEDNGKGFDPTTIRRNMGLSNIETRVKYLNGKMNIDAFPQKGTSISIECLI
jgi:signal transduction histidine kinase